MSANLYSQQDDDELLLLVENQQLILVQELLREKQITHHLSQESLSLIAIVGLDSNANQQIEQQLRQKFCSNNDYICHFTQQNRVLNFFISNLDAKQLLSDVYQFCFKPKLSPIRDCSQVE